MTITTRVGSLAILADTLRDTAVSQERLGKLQAQISSGYVSKTFDGLNGSVEQFTQVGGQLERAQQFTSNNQLNITKLQTADTALGKIYEMADQIKVAIVGATGAAVKTSNLPQVVEDLLASIGTELNATFNGAYIFGGTNTLNPPVPSTSQSNTIAGFPDDNYYAGSKQDVALRVDERSDLTFPVRADDISIQKIYAAAKQAVAAAKTNDPTGLSQAQQLIQSGLSDLSAARSRVGSTVVNVESINDRLVSLKNYWTELTDKISKTDILAASTEVSSYQAILQASFQVFSRLSQLRLSDYLK